MSVRRLIARARWAAEGLWLPIRGNFMGLAHAVRGHRVDWFRDPDPWAGHLGWVWCNHCPDTADADGTTDLILWEHGYYWQWLDRIREALCARFGGHREVRLAKRFATGELQFDENGDPVLEDVPGAWYCGRCLCGVRPPKERVQ